MNAAAAAEPDVLTEVPETLKRLIRYILRGFYDVGHSLVIDLLIHHPCIKEEDLLELLKFERKQLRTIMNTLKSEKFIKVRMRMETDAEGRPTKHNYYFINYSVFVNVIKYKLDHIRRKIETEERDNTSRASFKCPTCEKTFTDLEAGELFNPMTGEMRCTYCQMEVEEDASSQPKKDARSLMVKFNEQIEPIYSLLREVEDVKLAACILEPEPVDIIKGTRSSGTSGSRGGDKDMWSGDRKNRGFGSVESQVTVSMEGKGNLAMGADTKSVKEQPIWMVESTVEGAMPETSTRADLSLQPSTSEVQPERSRGMYNIMQTLLAHEKKASAPLVPGAPGSDEDTTSSESEAEETFGAVSAIGLPQPGSSNMLTAEAGAIEEMESDDEEEAVAMVTIGNQHVPFHEVSNEMAERMTPVEKEAYIKLGQEMYQDMYG